MTRKKSASKHTIVLLYTLLAGCVCILWALLSGGILLILLGGSFSDAGIFTFLQYVLYHASDKAVFSSMMAAAALAAAIVALTAALLFFALGRKQRPLYGDARFAKKSDIVKAGLLGEEGIIVGRRGQAYLLFAGQQHVLMSAPTRSGKGVGVVIPNLLSWPHSVVVLDVKLENWEITSGYRQLCGQACYLFNPSPADGRTHRYNPLAYVRDEAHLRVDDIQKIANILFPDTPNTDRIWTATPRSLFTGLVLYLMETPGKSVTFGQLLRETLTDGDLAVRLKRIVSERKDSASPLSFACEQGLRSFTSIEADNTRSGVLASFLSRLELWLNPLVDSATGENDFDLRNLRRSPMSVYVGITPDNLLRMAPIVNLFFQQLIDLNTRDIPSEKNGLTRPCLLLMDEFASIGKVSVLSKGIAYMAGYGLRMLPIIQSPAQLNEVYGHDAARTFRSNHALHIVFAPKASDTEAAREISEWLGYTTVAAKSESKPKGLFARGSASQNISGQKRALLLPQEVAGMGEDKALIILENVPPIMAEKVRYFEDASFTRRLDAVSEDPSMRAAHVPLTADLAKKDAIKADGGFIASRAASRLRGFLLESGETSSEASCDFGTEEGEKVANAKKSVSGNDCLL